VGDLAVDRPPALAVSDADGAGLENPHAWHSPRGRGGVRACDGNATASAWTSQAGGSLAAARWATTGCAGVRRGRHRFMSQRGESGGVSVLDDETGNCKESGRIIWRTGSTWSPWTRRPIKANPITVGYEGTRVLSNAHPHVNPRLASTAARGCSRCDDVTARAPRGPGSGNWRYRRSSRGGRTSA